MLLKKRWSSGIVKRVQFSSGKGRYLWIPILFSCLILDALNGTGFFDSFGIYMVAAEIADAISMDRLDVKWKVDGKELVAKLESLNNGQMHALVDSVQTWWNATTKQQMEYSQLFRI